MPLDNLDNFLEIIVCFLVVVEAVRQLLQSFKETIKVHLIIVTSTHHILVYYVVMSFQYVAVG